MKKSILLLALSLALCLAFAAIEENDFGLRKQAFKVTEKSPAHMNIQFNMPEYTVQELSEGEQVFHRIFIPDAGTTLDRGLPELPTITISLAIPRRGTPHVSLSDTHTELVNSFKAYPVQEGQELDSPKSFALNNDFYNTNTSYPQALIEYGDPYILRDFRLMNIQINPFSYNPLTQQLTVNHQINMHIQFTDEPGINEMEGEYESYSPAFEKIYEASIFNFDDYRYQMFSNRPPRYLLIYGNNSDQHFHSALNDFVLWKRQKGADVDVASTATNEAGTSTTTIKSYIQNRYNNPATRPDFIILLGDITGSYAIPGYTSPSGIGDYPYTHLEGNDPVGDAFIGRISAETLAQVQTLFAKIYLYERDININTAQWLNRMLLVANWNRSGISTIYVSRYIIEAAKIINPNYTFVEIFGSTPTPAAMNTAINQGVGFFSYRGLERMDGWSPSESLNNGFKLLHAVIPTCSTGNYDSNATTEQFVRLGTAAQPKGAVTACGMATNLTHTVFNNALHGGLWGGLLQYGMRTMGEALLNAKVFIHQLYHTTSPSNSLSFAHWFNLMGDPTMEVYFSTPKTFNVETQTSIPIGLSLMDINVKDTQMMPVENASVTISQGFNIISRGYTDADGNVIMVLPETMGAGECVMTVSKHDFKPSQITILINSQGSLVADTILIDDDNSGQTQGNGNGIADGGEVLELTFGLKNTTNYTIAGITGTLVTSSPYVTIEDPNVEYHPVFPGQTVSNTIPIVVHIAPHTPHQSMIRLFLQLEDSGGATYEVSEFLPVSNAKIVFQSYTLENAGAHGALNPGESAGLLVTLKNEGSVGIPEVYGRLYSLNDLISPTQHTVLYGDMITDVPILPSATSFEVYARPEVLPGMTIPMRIKMYNDLGFEQWVDFNFTVGHVTVNDPLGPDAYGYVIYDDTDTAYPECPVYNWVEIAPELGGLGVPLAISDVYVSNDEGDQVGATSLAVVNLPFSFQFYGLLYNQITVCSNGFIAMGVSENGEFRNYRLPGPMGPSPMIAPFWDDLATHPGSGIYTWFDRNNHAFIIEWYNMRNGANGVSPETFQVILYDPAVHAGSLGDGPIKIQYQIFNNIDATSGLLAHGNYATIGIKDHTSTVGLEYTYSNTYPVAASPLSNGRALYITNVPVYYETSHLVLGETYVNDPNGNGICEPGEMIELGIQVNNLGNLQVIDPIGTLSTTSEYVTMLNSESSYFPIAGEGNGVNREPFKFQIAANCPNETIINFNLDLVSDDQSWSRPFSLQVSASDLKYAGFLIDDSQSNHDGVITPGESFKLVVNVRNQSAVAAEDVLVTLNTIDPELIIAQQVMEKPMIESSDIMQYVFDMQYTGSNAEPHFKTLQLSASTSNGLPMEAALMIPCNMENIINDFETENGGFVSETGWAWGTPSQVSPYSGAKVWASNLSGSYPNLATYNLYTPVYALQTNSTMKFMHRYGFANNADGGNVSISLDGGNSWALIHPDGGYSHSSISGLNNAAGFSGTLNSWQQVSFDLSQYANQSVIFKFCLGSDENESDIGWFIDNFELYNLSQKVGFLRGSVMALSEVPPSTAIIRANNFFVTNPDADGNFSLFLPNGTYSVTASLLYHQSSTVHNIHISPNTPIHETEYMLVNLPKPEALNFAVDNDTGIVALAWSEPLDPFLPILQYKVYKRFDTGPFIMVQETQANSYTETISLEGEYKYYVVAAYMTADGAPSNVAAFSFPYVDSDDSHSPGMLTRLHNNYPNPFNPSTTFSFDLAKASNVKLNIYNLKGQLVRRLHNANMQSGNHKLVWNGRDENNRSVASGIYYYRLETKDYVQTKKMLMMK